MGLVRDKTPEAGQLPWTILIADDDAPTRILLRAAISQWGYKIVEARDGEEAWKLMTQPDAPRMIIIDWLMPGMNGIDLCKRVKGEISQYTYTILLTQQTGPANLITGLEAGADEFLSKPFNMNELRNRLTIGSRLLEYESRVAHQNQRMTEDRLKIVTALNEIEKMIEAIGDMNQTSDMKVKVAEIRKIIDQYK